MLHPKSAIDEDPIHVKITNVKKDSYEFEAVIGHSNFVQKGEIIKKSAMYWLVLAYFFHTIGELCASPVALSFITKLAPARWGAFMMGAYFAATGLGNKVAGIIGENASEVGDYWTFTGITIFCSIFGLLVILIL